MVKRGLFIVLGTSIAVVFACGENFQSNPGAGGRDVQSCTSRADCPIPSDGCTTVSCQNNTCLYVERDDNVPLPMDDQVIGDCKVTVCISGSSVDKPSDDPPASDDCKSFTCNEDGRAAQHNAGEGSPCGEDGALECDGMGQCTGCENTEQCPTSGDPCKPFSCDDQICVQTSLTNVQLPDDQAGDCKVPACNADGNQVTIANDEDHPDDPDPNDCVANVCSDGDVVVQPASEGTACSPPINGACCGTTCCNGRCNQGTCVQGAGSGGGTGTGGMGTGGMGTGGMGTGGNGN